MGRFNHDQGRLIYSFCLDEAVPNDHLVRAIACVLDLSWVQCQFLTLALQKKSRRLSSSILVVDPRSAAAVRSGHKRLGRKKKGNRLLCPPPVLPRETQTTRAALDGGIAGTRMNIIVEIALDLVDPSPMEDHT